MSAPGDVAPGPILPARLRGIPRGPAEGWLTLAFVLLMTLTVAWSFDDAAWVLGAREWGDFYAWAAALATLSGFITAKLRWPRWIAHLAGAVAAALILPLMVGSVLVPEGGSLGTLYRATAHSVVQAWVDLAILDLSLTTQSGHFLLAIGGIVWSVGQFAAYAVFAHRRPLDAVIVVGIVLLANMAVTYNDQLAYLVIFSIAALCVLARSHAFEEESTWLRRRIGDGAAIRSVYLRGGAAFTAFAVFGSLVLTASASSKPLASAWGGVGETIVDVSQGLQRYLPFGGAPRPVGFGFGSTATINGLWTNDNRVAVTIQRTPGDDTDHYWRAVAYDRFDLRAWTWTDPREVTREPGDPVLAELGDEPTDAVSRRTMQYTVEVSGAVTGDFVLSPLAPMSVDRETDVTVVGETGWFGGIEVDANRYSVAASVPLEGDEENGLTANRLRAAGTDYPAEIEQLYTQLPPQALGPEARALLANVQRRADDNPYDLAKAIETRLRSPEFVYDTDVRGVCDRMPSVVECFALYKRGYCLHYATAMTALLREAKVPARLVEGFLPGERDPRTGLETIKGSNAHAWVEVWFPGFGWHRFDPTGGNGTQPESLPAGDPVDATPTPGPSFGSVNDLPRGEEIERGDGNSNPVIPTGGTGRDGGNPALLAAVAILLLVAVGAIAFVAWQRGPRGEVTADSVWRGVSRTAARFGFGPRPQQTVYEYAGSLGEVLTTSRPELQTVARAKVEVAYGRQELGHDASESLREAQRRLRVALLRLALRRAERRGRRR